MSKRFAFLWLTLSLLLSLASSASADTATLRIGVNADFSNGEMRVVSVGVGGPATRIRGAQGTLAAVETGDIIRTVDGNVIRTHADYIAAVNNSLDGVLTIGVVDVNTGEVIQWQVTAIPTAATSYQIARDTYRRAIRLDSIYHPTLYLEVQNDVVSSGVAIVLPRIDENVPVQERSDELMRELIVGVQVIYEHQLEAPIRMFSDRDFQNVDRIIQPYFERMSSSNNEAYKGEQASAACKNVSDFLSGALARWAQSNNKQLKNVYGAPYTSPFRVKTSQPGAQVELLTVADMVLTLLKQRKDPSVLDDQSVSSLNNSFMWKRLDNNEARAYGNFYYRFVTFNNGVPSTTPFVRERKIDIKSVPDSGEIFFQ